MQDSDALQRQIQNLSDRQAIYDCLVRYCRGMDRLDRELILSAYHRDAIDDHGLFVGGPGEFADFFIGFHREHQHSTNHIISNHYVELEGDTAHCETYWTYAGMNKEGVRLTVMGGRYIDRMERRDGRWAIARRRCLTDWSGEPDASGLSPEVFDMLQSSGVNARDKSDSSYLRPLSVARQRIDNPPQASQ